MNRWTVMRNFPIFILYYWWWLPFCEKYQASDFNITEDFLIHYNTIIDKNYHLKNSFIEKNYLLADYLELPFGSPCLSFSNIIDWACFCPFMGGYFIQACLFLVVDKIGSVYMIEINELVLKAGQSVDRLIESEKFNICIFRKQSKIFVQNCNFSIGFLLQGLQLFKTLCW